MKSRKPLTHVVLRSCRAKGGFSLKVCSPANPGADGCVAKTGSEQVARAPGKAPAQGGGRVELRRPASKTVRHAASGRHARKILHVIHSRMHSFIYWGGVGSAGSAGSRWLEACWGQLDLVGVSWVELVCGGVC